jgi:hypothetical protein
MKMPLLPSYSNPRPVQMKILKREQLHTLNTRGVGGVNNQTPQKAVAYRSLKKSAVNHRYTTVQETDKPWAILNRSTLKHVLFYENIKDKQLFCGHNTMTKGVCNPAV